ncbi:MAG TPA: bi-domain-containing oxidoreductase [Terriglobales bacterium]|nr:bi-domain-containing oxidoreductase [Terriglobales bacterium]
MRAILEDLGSGAIGTYDVPQPELRPGGILIRTACSAISAGTERAQVEISQRTLVGKALARPDLVKQVIEFARANGFQAAYQKVQSKLGGLTSMGYSCAGTVCAVGTGVTEFQIGDRVACAGAGYATHAEVNWVPSNLAVRIPDEVEFDTASLVAIGAIAMQGLRQAQVSFGETVVVIGAGLVGVLAIQLARAAGCRVIAVDRDPQRVQQSNELGAHLSLLSSDPQLQAKVLAFSGYGADAAVVTAASSSAEPVELAAKSLRDRGRIVVVGTVPLGVARDSLYQKELTLALSRSYGPGRYDPAYEQEGHDYPIGFVRWTERRNMEAFLDFIAAGEVDLKPLTFHRAQVEDAAGAYQKIRSGGAYTVILEYVAASALIRPTPLPAPSVRSSEKLQRVTVGCIGAGDFAAAHIIPNLKHNPRVWLEAIATASGVRAERARRDFGFARAQTPSELVCNPDVDCVFVISRHSSHAAYVAAALRNGKAVFVEKPLAINREQLDSVKAAYHDALQQGRTGFVMLGFNRRFAAFTVAIDEFFAQRREPMVVHVRVNAGYLRPDHWTQLPSEGGRVVGEFCHFIDFARHLIGHPIRSVSASALPDGHRYSRDNVSVTLTFTDGSIANLLYLANGDPSLPKEYYEVFCEGAVARLHDFESLELIRHRKIRRLKAKRDKGHRRELELTIAAVRNGTASPIRFDELVEVTEASFAVSDAIASSAAIVLQPGWERVAAPELNYHAR